MTRKEECQADAPRRSAAPVILGTVLLLAALLTFAWVWQSRQTPIDPDARPGSQGLSQSPEEMMQLLAEQAEESRLRFTVNSVITAEADGSADLLLENAWENTQNIQAALTLDDGRELYRSRILSPGGQALLVRLTELPSPGDYDAVVHIQGIDRKSGAVTGQAEVEVTLHVREALP